MQQEELSDMDQKNKKTSLADNAVLGIFRNNVGIIGVLIIMFNNYAANRRLDRKRKIETFTSQLWPLQK